MGVRASDVDAASLTLAHQACCRKPVLRSTAARPWGAQSRHSVRLREASSDAHRHSAQQAHQTPSNPAKQAHIRPTNVGISSEVRSRPRRAYISAHLRAATPAVLGIHSVNKIFRRLSRSTPLGLHSIVPCGLLAQVVEHSTADRIVTGATPVRPFHFMPAACVTGTQAEPGSRPRVALWWEAGSCQSPADRCCCSQCPCTLYIQRMATPHATSCSLCFTIVARFTFWLHRNQLHRS